MNPDGKSITYAFLYNLTATNFWESAKTLDAQLDKNENSTPTKLTAIPFYFLVSHSMELFLKSALLKRGYTVQELKKQYIRHNLKKLLEKLQSKGLMITSETVEIVNNLHILHEKHGLRYDALFNIPPSSWLPTNSIHVALEELQLLTRISTQGK